PCPRRLAPDTPLLPRRSAGAMPAFADRLSEPLPAMFMYCSSCSADEMPCASISSFWITVTGSAASMSVRLMREPVTLIRSSVRVPAPSPAFVPSCAKAVPVSASAMANGSVETSAVVVRIRRTAMRFPGELSQDGRAQCRLCRLSVACPLPCCLTCSKRTCQFWQRFSPELPTVPVNRQPARNASRVAGGNALSLIAAIAKRARADRGHGRAPSVRRLSELQRERELPVARRLQEALLSEELIAVADARFEVLVHPHRLLAVEHVVDR